MTTLREIAKFASGAVAFHALVHLVLLFSGISLTIFGITQTPTLHVIAIVLSAIVSCSLGIYGWGFRPVGETTGRRFASPKAGR